MSVYNGICPNCRNQYTVHDATNTLTVNDTAADQQDRIDALEERIAQLEAIVQRLSEQNHSPLPEAPKAHTEEADFRKKYGYLF